MPSPKADLTRDLVGGLLLAVSVTMVTDFSHRLLGADPDSAGILSVSVQGLFAVAASSTFTEAGRVWIEGLRLHRPFLSLSTSGVRLLLAAALFAGVCPAWIWLPEILAQHYNTRAYNLQNSGGPSVEATNLAAVVRDYQRAIALDPGFWFAQFNLGEVFEQSYQYDAAATQYRKAIVANGQDPSGYGNLSRVLLLEGDALTALRVADDGMKLNPSGESAAALLKNRSWAELELTFYDQAVADAKLSLEKLPDGAAAYCMLGKSYAKLGDTADEQTAWENFLRVRSLPPKIEPMVEPDCVRLAEDFHEKK